VLNDITDTAKIKKIWYYICSQCARTDERSARSRIWKGKTSRKLCSTV